MAGDWNVETGRLWAVGVATSVVAALAALVVFLFATQVFDQTLFVNDGSGNLVELTAGPVLVVAFVAGIAATVVLWVLLLFVPRGDLFFGLIATIVFLLSFVAIATIPEEVPTETRLWLAGMHTVVYLVIVPTLSGSISRVAVPQVSHSGRL